jgi:hypothetical protein
MTEDSTTTIPTMEDWQHWALVVARANQMIMEAWADNLAKGKTMPGFGLPVGQATNDPMAWMTAGADAWSKGLESWIHRRDEPRQFRRSPTRGDERTIETKGENLLSGLKNMLATSARDSSPKPRERSRWAATSRRRRARWSKQTGCSSSSSMRR